MNPGAILIAAGIALIVTLLAIVYLFIDLIERAVARFADDGADEFSEPGSESQGPGAASKRSASGPNVYLLHGRDDD